MEASIILESASFQFWYVMASNLDALPHWILAGPMRLFYLYVDKAVDYDWTFVVQNTFWALMALLCLKMIDACFS